MGVGPGVHRAIGACTIDKRGELAVRPEGIGPQVFDNCISSATSAFVWGRTDPSDRSLNRKEGRFEFGGPLRAARKERVGGGGVAGPLPKRRKAEGRRRKELQPLGQSAELMAQTRDNTWPSCGRVAEWSDDWADSRTYFIYRRVMRCGQDGPYTRRPTKAICRYGRGG